MGGYKRRYEVEATKHPVQPQCADNSLPANASCCDLAVVVRAEQRPSNHSVALLTRLSRPSYLPGPRSLHPLQHLARSVKHSVGSSDELKHG